MFFFSHVFIPTNVKTSPSSTHISLVMLFNYVKLLFYCNPSTPGNDPLVLSTVSTVTHRNDGMISNDVFQIHLKSTSGQEGGYFPTMPMWKTSGDPAILRGTVAGYGREYSATSAQSMRKNVCNWLMVSSIGLGFTCPPVDKGGNGQSTIFRWCSN